ncbi:MAG: tetratricopeptide repeat protein [Pseudomonadota bacterium]|nr:tetratricopeptide repeat protein [Pseudomonadota bacterium]
MYTPTLRTASSRSQIAERPSRTAHGAPADSVELSSTLDPRDEALALFNAGRREEAVVTLQEALAAATTDPQGWNDLGNMLAHLDRLSEAATAFRRALGRAPRSAALWNNLGAVLQRDGHAVGAECAFRRAIALQDNFHQAHQNLAQLLESRGESLEAARHHCLAFVHGPRDGKTFAMLGLAYYHLGKMDAAAQVYRDWLNAEPDNPVARHRLAACLREGVPTRVSDAYVEATFDAFAPTFDTHLRELGYQGPALIAQALADCGTGPVSWRVLDAGCGTGLCGEVLRPFASQLDGVDLSAAMLARAYPRGLYDRLEKSELTAFMNSQRHAYDLVAAADSFNYFGELFPVFEAAANALVPGGVLVFTVEDGDGRCGDSGWHLAMHGRYVHDSRTVMQWLDLAGFSLSCVRSAALRRELGEEVHGRVFAARRR